MKIEIHVCDKKGHNEILTANSNIDRNRHIKVIQDTVKKAGFDWNESDVFVPNFPERGRYLQKGAGFQNMCAGG